MAEKKSSKVKTNVFDYLIWRGDIPFTFDGVNEVDALIFTILAYLDYPDKATGEIITLKEAAKILSDIPEKERPEGPDMIMDKAYEFISLAADSERYGHLEITDFVNMVNLERELQFSAVTFHLPGDTRFIAVRGTDNNLIGWKEDMALSFSEEVPAQIEAAAYTRKMFEKYSGRFYIAGHSKGGNLAIWAAAHIPSQDKERLAGVFNNDGPGFSTDFLQSGDYRDIQEKVHSFIPESSLVGVLMEHDEYETISSTGTSILQHAPFSWTVSGAKLVRADKRTISGAHLDNNANAWIRSMSLEEREGFVDILFEVLMAADARTLGDLSGNKLKNFTAINKKIRSLDPDRKALLKECIRKIFINEERDSKGWLFRALFDKDND
ncbi:MAG: DUF2974 domain-containing protein [Bacillota bacterium]|nr:DUF2974 domain-containing protein [Bacillota bacterium]